MIRLLFSLCFITAAVQLPAQNPFARYKVEHYDSKNGMPNDFVMNTYQTMDGFIWMNSYSGYIRFDGRQFVTFNSSNTPAFKTDNSNSLFTESADSTLWFPISGVGLVGYKKGVFTSYLSGSNFVFLRGKTRKGELILGPAGTDDKLELIVFDPKTKKHFSIKQSEYLNYRYQSPKGDGAYFASWYAQNGYVYHKETNGKWRELGPADGLLPDVYIVSIFQDSRQRVWLTSSLGIYLWDGKRFNAFPGMEKVIVPTPNPSFAYIAEDADHGIWVSVGNGVAYLPDGDNRFYTFPRQYLKIQTLHNITVDREQNIWLASDRGLFKLSKTKVTNYAEAEGITNNRIAGVCEVMHGKFMLISSMDSLYWLQDGRVKPYKVKKTEGFKSIANSIHSKTDRQGNIWVTHQTGVLKISPQGETNYILPGQTRYAAEGLDGRMYFGVAYKGIYYISERGEVKSLDFPEVDFSQTYISALHQLKDTSWLVTTYRTGAMIIDRKGKATNLDLFNRVEGVQIFNALEGNEGTLWFATGRGVVKWLNGKAQLIGAESGLKETSFFGIYPDRQGTWWFPTNKGIYYATYQQLEAYLESNNNKIDWKYLDDGDGMNNRQCVGARHSIVGQDGKIYVPSIGGLVVVDPNNLQLNPLPPLVSINSLQVDDSLFYASSVIPPGDHRYIFDYSALSFVAPAKNQIRFRLVGRDKDWIISKGDNRAFYTNLPPRDYRFEVMASNNDGVWSKSAAVFSFTQKPFFYQTLLFKIIAVLLALGVIWLLVRWRTRAARMKNVWLEKEVAQRTSDLKKSLDQLQSTQSQLIQSEKMASLGELTAGIAHEIQNPLNFVNNFSEVSTELIGELVEEVDKCNYDEVKAIATDVVANLEKIHHHGKRADAIVKGMLQHSRTSSGQKEPTDINALCDEYLRLAYHGLKARDNSFEASFHFEPDNTLPKVNVVPQDMGRVLLNLINNAFQAVSERKKSEGENYVPEVIVSTKLIFPPAGFTSEAKGRNEVRRGAVSVSDNGPGIPDSIKEKIFQPFFTTKPTGQGTGLGLSLSYDIVKAHGGIIEVESIEGEGTTFVVKIPII
jgi:signal transduction histidine kinase/ligand-binding sensor domain-containing protein